MLDTTNFLIHKLSLQIFRPMQFEDNTTVFDAVKYILLERIPVVKNVCPLLTALSELGALKIQDDLSESLNLLILLPALFPERINGALQHGQLPLNGKKYLRLLHAASTVLHA